jgi:hypothetical protein
VGKYGTNLEGFGGFEGGVNADKGAPLVSTSSDGETALLFGPAALREIQAGVANGDFAIPPDAAGDTITEENPLPYWTFTDVNSAGAITCAVVADATAGSGSVLRWSIANTTGTGKSAKITRYIPVPASRDRAFVFIPEAFLGTRTGTNFSVTLAYTWATSDLTATGTGDTKTISTGATLLSVDTTPLNSAAPADAAFIYVTLTIATTGTTSGTTTQDISEIRLHRGDQGLYITDTSSASFAPARISSTSNVLKIEAATGDAYPISIKTGAAVNNAVVVFGDGATGGAIRGGGGTGRLDMLSANQSAYANVVADRFYPGSQVTRYIDDNGTSIVSNGPLVGSSTVYATTTLQSGTTLITGGNITCGGVILNNTPTTTTATTNAGIWVLISGTTYELRRNSSSARYKTNIVDADAAVLEAAKKIKPRHYESAIAEEAGETRLGFIAEEVLATGLSHAVGYDAEGRVETLDTTALIAALFARVNDLEERLAALEAR